MGRLIENRLGAVYVVTHMGRKAGEFHPGDDEGKSCGDEKGKSIGIGAANEKAKKAGCQVQDTKGEPCAEGGHLEIKVGEENVENLHDPGEKDGKEKHVEHIDFVARDVCPGKEGGTEGQKEEGEKELEFHHLTELNQRV